MPQQSQQQAPKARLRSADKKDRPSSQRNHWLDESCLRDARVIGEAGRILGVGGEAHSVVPRLLLTSLQVDRSAVIKYRRNQLHEAGANAAPRLSRSTNGGRRLSTADTSPLRVPSKKNSKWKLFQATGTLLLNVGFDIKFDSALWSEDAGCSSHRLLQKASLSGELKLPVNDFAKLEAEVLTGECTLQYSLEGDIERVVPIEVIRLERQDSRVYTRVGMWERRDQKWLAVKARLEFPGTKRSYCEDPAEVINRVIFDEIPMYWKRVTLSDTNVEVVASKSSSFGVRTQYNRTVHTGLLDASIERAAGTDDNLVPSVLNGGNKVVLYGWVSEAELLAGQAEAVAERLREWMNLFQQHLDGTMNQVYNATKGRRRDDCARKLAYLTWWRNGKPEQSMQKKAQAWDAASRSVDEACSSGATQEELIAEYDLNFVQMAVEELIQDSFIVQSLKECWKT